MKPVDERRPYEAWPDIKAGDIYVGTGGGMRGCRCRAISQSETMFGHKFAYVIWLDKPPDGVPVDEHGGSNVRTALLDAAPGEPYTEETSPQARDQGYDDDYDPRG